MDLDIRAFFDSLDPARLKGMLRERISDRKVLDLIDKWLRAGVLDGQELIYSHQGTPQGSVISAYLLRASKIVLTERHAKVRRKGYRQSAPLQRS